jgi:glycosyltransferase involved in cell wall biosynthesis
MAEKKRVLMLLSNPFRPDPRVHREAKSLVNAGYGVTILCWDREQKYPPKETIDGIEIRRLGPASGYASSREMVRSLPKFWKNLRKEAAGINFDIVHSHDLDTLSPGLKISSLRKVPLIYDSHEIYHEMAGENLSPFFVKLLAAYERNMVRKPRMMITVNEPIADIFKNYGASDVRIIMNCQPDAPTDPAKVEETRKKLALDGKRIALYIGVLEPNRLLLELAETHSKGKDDFILVIGGFGSLESRLASIADASNGRVRFIGKVEPASVPAHNAVASVLLAAYDPALKNNRMGAPNKLFEAMASSKPVIVSKGTYAARVVEESGCGLAADYTAASVLAAASALLGDPSLHAKYSAAGRKAYDEKYNWSVMEKRLLGIYSELLKF